MGATASAEEEVIGGVRTQRVPISKRSWRTRKNFVLAKWQKREQQSQAFGVVRHAERADSVYALYQGTRWTMTEDFHKYPMDPPLSDAGLEAAFEETAQRIARFSVENTARIAIVVSSPYFRCVQTAVEVCRALGPGVRLLIDNSLGEVYGPAVMGEREPSMPTRPMDQIVYYARSRGVKCISKVIGRWPQWPEDLQAARRRYADRFLTFLQRSTVARRNFVLVTHGDCVGATVTMMPSEGGSKLEKVEYGGMFLGKRKDQRANSSSAKDPAVSCGRVAECRMHGVLRTAAETDEEPDEEAEIIDNPRLWSEVSRLDGPEEAWMQARGDAPGAPRDFLPPEPPKASDGWQVETHDLVTRAKSRKSTAEVFTKKVTSLVKSSKFSRQQIETLLGELADKPLGDTDESINAAAQQRHADVAMGPTSSNYSTLFFGASEIGTPSECSEGFGSERGVTNTTESFDQHMSMLKAQRRRPLRPKTQSSQPKTPKFPAMARTDEMAPTLSDETSGGASFNHSFNPADELVAGALMWSPDLDVTGLPSPGSPGPLQETKAGHESPGGRRNILSVAQLLAQQHCAEQDATAPRSPRAPVLGALQNSALLKRRGLDPQPQLAAAPAQLEAPLAGAPIQSHEGPPVHAQLAGALVQPQAAPAALGGLPLLMQAPLAGAPMLAAAPVQAHTAPAALGCLQNSLLMRRRGLEGGPARPPAFAASPPSAEETAPRGASPLAGMQNSMLLRRRSAAPAPAPLQLCTASPPQGADAAADFGCREALVSSHPHETPAERQAACPSEPPPVAMCPAGGSLEEAPGLAVSGALSMRA